MNGDAFRQALIPRTPEQPIYEADIVGPQVWEFASRIVAAQDAARLGQITPSGAEVGRSALAARPAAQSSAPVVVGAGALDAKLPDALTSRADQATRRRTPQSLPPPAPLPAAITGELPGLDAPALDSALRRVDGGPTLEDFGRFGTLPGFGDPQQDPFATELRRRLTVLVRSA